MKKHLLSAIFILFVMGLKAQTINSITSIPNPATTNDQVKIIINTTFPNNCISNSFTYNISGSQVQIYMYQCLGLLNIVCTRTDTVNIGQLPQGVYVTYVFISTAQANPNCTSFTPPLPPNQLYTFQVQLASSIVAPGSEDHLLTLYPNPASSICTVNFGAVILISGELFITDIFGKEIERISIDDNSTMTELNTENLSNGIYFIHLLRSGQILDSGKLIISR